MPGQHVSLMDALVAKGYAAYALAALSGYGIATAYVLPWAMVPDRSDSTIVHSSR